MPARARVAAMPGPIVPKPMTAAFFISPCGCKRGSGLRLLVGGSGRNLVSPGPDAGKRRQRDGEAQATIDDGSETDIGDRKIRSRDPRAPGRSLLENLELRCQRLGI